jgi:hypothetical protein
VGPALHHLLLLLLSLTAACSRHLLLLLWLHSLEGLRNAAAAALVQ